MISTIAHGFFAASSVLWLPVVALLVFMTIFTVVSVRTLRRRRDELDDAAGLPLEDDRAMGGRDE